VPEANKRMIRMTKLNAGLFAATAVAACLAVGDGVSFAQQAPPAAQDQTITRHQARRQARIEKRVERRLKRLDKNGDGVIWRDEWTRRPRAFDRIDTNHDGVLSADELRAAAARVKHRHR
jgi:EF hand domain-containing protein